MCETGDVVGAPLVAWFFAKGAAVPLIIIDDLRMRKLPYTGCRGRASTLPTSNRPADDSTELLRDTQPSRPRSIAYCIPGTFSSAD